MEPLLKSQDNPDHSTSSSSNKDGTVVGGLMLVGGKWLPPNHHFAQHQQSNPITSTATSSPSSLSSSIALQYVPLSSPQGSSSAGSSGASQKSFVFCRICHEGDISATSPLSYTSQASNSSAGSGRPRRGEPLITPCHCTGSVAMVHLTCLEHWLTTSNSDKCELCHFIYKTKRIPRSWTEFLTDSDNQFNIRNMIADLICFFLLTPLLVISTYLCCIGAHEYYLRERWEAVGLVTLSIFLLMVYFTWCQVTLKYHIGVWLSWVRTHQRIRIIFGDGSTNRFFRRRSNNGASSSVAQHPQQNTSNPLHHNNNYSLHNTNFISVIEI